MNTLNDLPDDELMHQLRRARHELPDVPQDMHRAAIALWTAAPKESLAAVLRRIVGMLSFDSWAAPLALQGVRSARGVTRHLLYSAEGRDIDLRVEPHGEVFALTGQILGPDERGEAELVCGDGPQARAAGFATLDAMGEFRIGEIAPGRYALTLRFDADEVVLAGIEVGDCPS